MAEPENMHRSGSRDPSNEVKLEGFMLSSQERVMISDLLSGQYKILGDDPGDYPAIARRCHMQEVKCRVIIELLLYRILNPQQTSGEGRRTLEQKERDYIRYFLDKQSAANGFPVDDDENVHKRVVIEAMECRAILQVLGMRLRRAIADGSVVAGSSANKDLQGMFGNPGFEKFLRGIIRDEIGAALDHKPGKAEEPALQPSEVIHFKIEGRETWMWAGAGDPATGEGKWVRQIFKKWPPTNTSAPTGQGTTL